MKVKNNKRPMLIVLAGGLGSRPYPLTAKKHWDHQILKKNGLNKFSYNSNAIPKPLIPIGNVPLMKPLCKEIVRQLGIKDIAMTLMYMPQDIKQYFGTNMEAIRTSAGSSFYWEEQDEFNLNTAGSTIAGWKNNMKHLADRPNDYIVISADIRANPDMRIMYSKHKAANALATIALAPVPREFVGRFGTVFREGDENDTHLKNNYSKVLEFIEKDPHSKSHICYSSISIISDRLMRLIEDDMEFTADPFTPLKKNEVALTNNKRLRLGVFSSYLKKIGSIEEGQVNPDFNDWGSHIFPDITQGHPQLYKAKESGDPEGFYGCVLPGLWSDDGTKQYKI